MPLQIDQTLAIIKPDAFENRVIGKILTMMEEQNLKIASMVMVRLTGAEAGRFYAVHQGKPFYEPLLEFMSSGPCLALVLEGDNVIERWRTLMGPTDPSKAPEGTIRRNFGTTIRRNAVHGSDSLQNALSEIKFFFDSDSAGNRGAFRKESST